MNWPITISVAAFLIGLGKFIDDFHFSPNSSRSIQIREIIQDFIVRMFVMLDRVDIPNVPPAVCKFIFVYKLRLSFVMFMRIAICYFLTVFLLYSFIIISTSHSIPSSHNADFDVRAAILQVSGVATTVFMGVSLPAGRFFLRSIEKRSPLARQIMAPIFIFLMTIAVFLGILLVIEINRALHSFPPVGLPGNAAAKILVMGVIFVLAGVFIEPTMLILFLTGILGCALTLVVITRLLLLTIFDRASDPKKSPFAYCFSLLGVMLLLIKTIQEIVKLKRNSRTAIADAPITQI